MREHVEGCKAGPVSMPGRGRMLQMLKTLLMFGRMKVSFLFSTVFLMIAVRVMSQVPYDVISTNTEKDLIPEGIAIDPHNKKIYVSSIALKKVVSIDQSGTYRNFIGSNQDGFLEGLGIKIDEKKRWLWVVSNQRQGSWYTSQVHAFDLKTGSVKQHYVLRDTVEHLFNDLTLHPNNKVYVTDTFASSIYQVDPAGQKMELFIQDPMLARANGIAHNGKGRIFIATRNGLVQLDHQSKALTPLTYSNSKTALWMDGIVYWNNSIIGVADDVIMQYELDEDDNRITGERVIDKTNKHFHDPTTAALLSGKLYVLANSYLSAYNENKESVGGIENKLGHTVIVVYHLKH